MPGSPKYPPYRHHDTNSQLLTHIHRITVVLLLMTELEHPAASTQPMRPELLIFLTPKY